MELLVNATNLSKSFGETRAVDGVSLEIAAGEIYGLVGADGAGKT
ncbi:MAG TPA: ABC transporter ATP-binding protein, partial [Roseiflexaceae bacterium]